MAAAQPLREFGPAAAYELGVASRSAAKPQIV